MLCTTTTARFSLLLLLLLLPLLLLPLRSRLACVYAVGLRLLWSSCSLFLRCPSRLLLCLGLLLQLRR